MTHSKSSQRWLHEHFNDVYVKRAQKEGYRSRAAYKLIEIQEKDKILQKGMIVIDLGAAPGGWSVVAKRYVGENGRVLAVDLLPMIGIPGVEFTQGDFNDPEIVQQLLRFIDNNPVDLVMSDMAPNISGIISADVARSLNLAELAFDFATQVLACGGKLLVKLFQGAGFDAYLKLLRAHFDVVLIRKPKASRPRSSEVYLLAKGYKNNLAENSL